MDFTYDVHTVAAAAVYVSLDIAFNAVWDTVGSEGEETFVC